MHNVCFVPSDKYFPLHGNLSCRPRERRWRDSECCRLAGAADCVWLEGKSPSAVPAGMTVAWAGHSEFLAGRQWLTFMAEAGDVEKKVPPEGFVVNYPFSVKKSGSRQLWIRLGFEFARSPLEWRVDDGAWTTVSPDDLTTDLMELSFFCEVAWLKLADVDLAAGRHAIDIRLPRYKDAKGQNQSHDLRTGCHLSDGR